MLTKDLNLFSAKNRTPNIRWLSRFGCTTKYISMNVRYYNELPIVQRVSDCITIHRNVCIAGVPYRDLLQRRYLHSVPLGLHAERGLPNRVANAVFNGNYSYRVFERRYEHLHRNGRHSRLFALLCII